MEPQDPTTTDPQKPATAVYQAPPAVPPVPVSPLPPITPAAAEPVMPEPYIPPQEEDPGGAPMVVVPDVTSSRVPKWFLIVFGITVLIFFAITTLLVLSMLQKSSPPTPASNPAPTMAATGGIPTGIPTEAASSSGSLQGQGTDDVDALNADAQNVDFSDMDETLIP